MRKKDILIGLALAVLIAVLVAPFSSPWPDGLERVAQDQGFLEKGAVSPLVASPIPDYSFPGYQNKILAASFAGLVGTLVMFGIGCGIAALIKKWKT